MRTRSAVRTFGCLAMALGVGWGCGHDSTLRQYLTVRFWLPFVKDPGDFERRNVKRIAVPYAGMLRTAGASPLAVLRTAYQGISTPEAEGFDSAKLASALANARGDASLAVKEREEVELIAAKIEMRRGVPRDPEVMRSARRKLDTFLRTARSPDYLSEARGWIAHLDYHLGNTSAAGKAYIDELNRDGSNIDRDTLVASLQMLYGFNGGDNLLTHLGEYFDTPEHAGFAINLATNRRPARRDYEDELGPAPAPPYKLITGLLGKHGDLFRQPRGSELLATLGMRIALSSGDLAAAEQIETRVPAASEVRQSPDFLWMTASTRFLLHKYREAETPLLRLFQSRTATGQQHAAAAYGLCGVYAKLGNKIEQLRFALWLRAAGRQLKPDGIWGDLAVYWASSGFDLGLIVDAEVSVQQLREFIEKYPRAGDIDLIRYSLAVRLARADQYEESALLYEETRAKARAERVRALAGLYAAANRPGLALEAELEAEYKFAEFLAANSERIYFNNRLWSGYQREALSSGEDVRLSALEHKQALTLERKLKDEREEYWRAYKLLSEIVDRAGSSEIGRRAATLAIRCLRRISTDRFGRENEIRDADIRLSRWLRNN